MSKKGFIEKIGTVIEKLPDAKFLIKLDDDESVVTGYLSGKMQRARIRVLAGDKVKLEFSPYDVNTGRITFRLKNQVVNLESQIHKKWKLNQVLKNYVVTAKW